MYTAVLPAIGVVFRRSFSRSRQGAVWICRRAFRDEAGGAYYGAIFARQYESALHAGLLAQAGEQRK